MTKVPERGVVAQFASLVPPARFGGAERVVDAFTDDLEAAGFAVHNQGLKPRGRRFRDAPGHPINNIYWPFDGRQRGIVRRTALHAVDTFTLASRRVVSAVMGELRPDVVITHNLRGWGFAPWVVAAEHSVPLVHVVHDYGLLCNATTLWRGEVCTGVCAPCRPRARETRKRWPNGQLVGVSAAVLAEHRTRGLPQFDEAVVIHPVAAAQGPQCQPDIDLDRAPATIGYLGRLTEAKGIDLLARAVRGSPSRLIVAGDGDPTFIAAVEAVAPGQVDVRGWVDPDVLFGEIDVLVVPSVWLEPFGLVVVEAAAAGVPVLISDRPGLIEAARASAARYATFEAGSVDALRMALERPLCDYRREPISAESHTIVDVVSRLLPQSR